MIHTDKDLFSSQIYLNLIRLSIPSHDAGARRRRWLINSPLNSSKTKPVQRDWNERKEDKVKRQRNIRLNDPLLILLISITNFVVPSYVCTIPSSTINQKCTHFVSFTMDIAGFIMVSPPLPCVNFTILLRSLTVYKPTRVWTHISMSQGIFSLRTFFFVLIHVFMSVWLT